MFAASNISVCAAAAVLLSLLFGGTSTQAMDVNAPLPLKVVGTNILNSRGETVLLRGVNTASLEWSSDGQGRILQTIGVAIHDWHANVIRLPLSQDRWFGYGPEQTDDGKAYRALVRQLVDFCATNKCYIILDLHWSDCNEWGHNIGQHSMPDTNSLAFWRDFAPIFANNPAVLYDLYNEPHDVSWDVWLNGGVITDKPNGRHAMDAPKTFEAVGMQTLLDAVRAAGAKNVVVAGGLDWAYDFSGILDGHRLADPNGNGVIYANHCYDNKHESVQAWISKMLHVMRTLDDHHWSWTAWDLHTAAKPNLISDWDYTPTPNFGVYVKQALAGGPLPDK